MKKAFRVFLFATVLVAIAHSYPGAARDSLESSDEGQKNEGVDTVLVLPGQKNPFTGSIFQDADPDDDSVGGFLPPGYYSPFSVNPFNGILTSMQSAMNKLREQMVGVLSRIPEDGFVSPWSKIPDGANTTSTTKVIDGHVVTINETTYSSGDDRHGAVFRVRIIDVKPQNDTLDTIGSDVESEVSTGSSDAEGSTTEVDGSTPARSVETVEDVSNNEIPKSQIEILRA